MTDLAQTIMHEIEALPEARLPNVLAYVRFLKLGLDADKKEIAARFDKSWARAKARAQTLNLTEADIEAEIRAVREGR